MKRKQYLMLARRMHHKETSINGQLVNIFGNYGMRAEIKKVFVLNGYNWYLVLNPEGAYKYLVCNEAGFSIAMGNTQKKTIEESKKALSDKSDNWVKDCVNQSQEFIKQIKVTIL
ncbi:hypothetical protein [Bacillus sp. ISTL8]|uniref:hypothetical protein n=1 Tax=Bacillus sp. ISTL8 TaxID=2596896 RepID=UPI001456D533|nr:hypothetical protein [Bacillus sp. ISTL8]